MKKKLLYIISQVENSHTFENTFRFLDKDKFELVVVFMHPHIPMLMKKTEKLGFKSYHILFIKKPTSYFLVLAKLVHIIFKEKPYIVHTHLIDGSFFGLVAAYICRVKHRFYTRHHSTYHWVYAKHAVKYDKIINSLSTKIIAISDLVKNVLIEKENVNPNKIVLVNHGFNLSVFSKKDELEIVQLKKKYNLENNEPIIGNISRFIEEKGVTYVIDAFGLFLKKYPDSVLILANAIGVYKDVIFNKLKNIPEKNYRVIEFETKIGSLYHCFDIFTHVPIDEHTEAFGQIYVEALAAGVPSIFTDSGIASEFIRDKENALIVPYKNANAIYNAMMFYMENDSLKRKIIETGTIDVTNLYSIEKMIKVLEKVYNV